MSCQQTNLTLCLRVADRDGGELGRVGGGGRVAAAPILGRKASSAAHGGSSDAVPISELCECLDSARPESPRAEGPNSPCTQTAEN